MLNPFILLGLIAAICIIGLIGIALKVRRVNQRVTTVVDFNAHFTRLANKYMEEGEIDQKSYNWLLENVDEVSELLGGSGVVSYKPPFASYIDTNYHIVLNIIPQFKTEIGPHQDEISMVEAIVRRFIGTGRKVIKNRSNELKNPVKWLQEGMSLLLSLPFELLSQVGLVRKRWITKLKGSKLFTSVTTLLAIVGAIETILAFAQQKSLLLELLKTIVK